MALRDNYNRVQGNDDTFTPEEIAEQDAWIDMFVQTKVGEYLFNFLSAKGLFWYFIFFRIKIKVFKKGQYCSCTSNLSCGISSET